MARNPSGSKPAKSSGTQQMETYKGPDPTGGPPASGGNRRVGDDERRGLAAFEKSAPAPSSQDGGRGSSRWGGGGAPSRPPGKSESAEPARRNHDQDDDEELRRLRLGASVRDDDDEGEMVVVSSTAWGDEDAPTPRGKKGKPARRDVEVEEDDAGYVEDEAPKKSSAWKWIGGAALLVAVGGGAAVGISAMQKSGAPPTGADAAEASKPKEPSAFDEEPKDETKVAARGEPAAPKDEPADGAKEAAAKEEPAEKPAEKPIEKAAPAKPAEPPAPTGPEPWAASALALNGWVAVPAAPEGKVLGLSMTESSDTLAATRTGFRAAASIGAPRAAYRLQGHEVTWGELAVATSPPELAAAPRPSWLPRDAKKAAALPATGLPWALARRFCQGLGGDLPSEAEWEWAARGPEDNYFPWGRGALDTNEIRVFAGRPIPVAPAAGSKLDVTTGATPIHDLLGNAQEWTRDAWRPGDPSAAADPRAATHKAVRGWPLADKGARIPAEGATYRAPGCADPACLEAEAKQLERIGFRCMVPGT